MADTVPALTEYKVSYTMCSGSTKKGCCFPGEGDFNRQLPPPRPLRPVMLPRGGPPRSGLGCSSSSP